MLLLAGISPQIRDVASGSVLATLQLTPPFTELGEAVWADQGREIIGVAEEPLTNPSHKPFPRSAQVDVWNTSTGTAHSSGEFTFYGEVWISPDGTRLAIETADQRFQFWNLATDKLVATTDALASPPGSIAWSPDGAFLALGENSATWPKAPGQVQVWSSSTGKLVTTLSDTDTFEGTIGGLAWSPNGQYLAESSGEIHIWSTTNWQQVASFGKVATRAPQGSDGLTRFTWIETITWSPDGSMLASVSGSLTSGPQTPPAAMQQTLHIWKLS
jgi:WD40 repeat protein